MKIALVIGRFLPEKGGTERYVQILAEGLVRRGHSVSILAGKFPKGTAAPKGIAFQPVRVPPGPVFLRRAFFPHACRRTVKKGGFDIVHDVGRCVGADVFNPHGGVEQAWLKRYFASYRRPLYRFFKRTQRLLSPREWAMIFLQKRQFLSETTHRIIAISPMIKDHILAWYPELDSRKISVVLNPADLALYNPENRVRYREAARGRLALSNNEVAILFAGNNFRLKGLEPLINSLALLKATAEPTPPFRLLIAGNESPARWRRRCRETGVEDRVDFIGHVQSMRELYAAADIFALPTFFDSFSLVVLEALASGLPVVTTKWCGAAFLIAGPETGIVLDDNTDIPALAGALRFYFDAAARAAARAAAPSAVVSCDTETHLDHILEIYRHILKEKIHG